MSFDWCEYLNLAFELGGQSDAQGAQDAKLRTAVSRAYYAAFCTARNYLRDVECLPVPQGPRAHGFVLDEFTARTDRRLKQVGTRLDRLRIDRNKADYDDVVSGLESMTALALKLGQRVISTLSAL